MNAPPRRARGIRYLRPALRWSGVGTLLRRARAWQGVLVLNYHRIGDGRDSVFDRGLWSATPDDFDRQLGLLKSHCEVIGPNDLPAAVRTRRGRFGLVTFDDGYRDNYEAAFPVLRSHRVPATFFVTTDFIDRPQLPWWDEVAWMVRTSRKNSIAVEPWVSRDIPFDEPGRERAVRMLLRAYKAMPAAETGAYMDRLGEITGSGRYAGDAPSRLWMTWDMLRDMSRAGMSIGGHTASHPILARCDARVQRQEVDGCKKRIEAEIGKPMQCFSYPVGGRAAFDDITREALRAAGVDFAFSYYGRFRRFGAWDAYDIPRVAIEQETTLRDLKEVLALPQVFA